MKSFDAEWFMAAAFQGQYVLTQGIAVLRVSEMGISADFFFDNAAEKYLTLVGTFGADGHLSAVAKSSDDSVPDINLTGETYGDEELLSIVLTDGTTTLGICARDTDLVRA